MPIVLPSVPVRVTVELRVRRGAIAELDTARIGRLAGMLGSAGTLVVDTGAASSVDRSVATRLAEIVVVSGVNVELVGTGMAAPWMAVLLRAELARLLVYEAVKS